MPSKPDPKMDDLLNAYARKRRADLGAAPPELHPVTRRLLQDEVANVYRTPGAGAEPKRWSAAWFWRWRLLAPALGSIVVISVCVLLLLPSRQGLQPQMSLAKDTQNSAPGGK